MTSKKHHYIPQFILRNFADSGERLVVRPIAREGEFIARVRDIGHRNRGHSLYFPGREADHDSLETAMSKLEGAASEAVGRLGAGRRRAISDDDRETLAYFVALQWSRHAFLVDAVRAEALRQEPIDESHPGYEYATRSLGLIQIITNVLEPWRALQSGDWRKPKEVFSSVASSVLAMHWNVVRAQSEALIVSDNIVCLSGVAAGKSHAAPTEAWTHHGIGVGFANCRRVTVPLAPRLALVMAPNSRDAANVRADHINRFTVANSREFIAYRPAWPDQQPRRSSVVENCLFTQRFLIADALKHIRL